MSTAGDPAVHPDSAPSSEAEAGPALPLAWRGAILAIAVVQFLVGHGAVWEHMFDWDAAILWSYASIPVLVLVALALRRRLAFVPWLVHSLEVGGAKFAVTATFLVVLLVSRHDPNARPPAPKPAELAPAAAVVATKPKPTREPTPIDPASTGTVRGTVLRQGAPVEGALVWVARGLGDRVFAPPSETFGIENDGTRIAPTLGALVLGQPVVARSLNGELHTLWLRPLDDVNAKMNVSVLGSGVPARISFPDTFEGVATIECAVHRAREGKSYLGIFRHPHFTRTDAAGKFELAGVPAGELAIAAFAPSFGRGERSTKLAAQGATAVEIELAPRGSEKKD